MELIPGKRVRCVVRGADSNGFRVDVVGGLENAFLSSRGLHSTGDEVLATVVCFDKKQKRLLLWDQFASGRSDRKGFGDTAGGGKI